MLSDRDIRRRMSKDRWSYDADDESQWRIRIEPEPEDDCFQPHSVELTLFHEIQIESASGWALNEPEWKKLDITGYDAFPELGRTGQYPVMPGQFLLASTVEKVYVPIDMAARADGKSSNGRRGLGIHVTAGLLDAGWEGTVTLEITNSSSHAFWLKPGMKICQLTFETLTSPVERPYGHPELGSHYQGQSGPTPAAI